MEGDNQMPVRVFFAPVEGGESQASLRDKIERLYGAADLSSCIVEGDLVAIKLHIGEKGGSTYLPPYCLEPIVDRVKADGGKPFLTDTNTLYRGQRTNAVDHLHLAYEHGFSIENVGAPMIIADGLLGRNEIEVDIDGEIYNKVSVATEAAMADALIVVSHATGHPGAGFGASLKNIGMGFSSRKGKLAQHSDMPPRIDESRCTGCQTCIRWCPQNTIVMRGEVAFIIQENCIGCGECLAVCRFNAVTFQWGKSSELLQKRIVEHALGVVKDKQGKIGCMNFIISVTRGCDCFGTAQKPIIPDIGILAGKDPVALDKATLDLIRQRNNRELSELTYPHIDPYIQIRHAEKIGLGQTSYELIEV